MIFVYTPQERERLQALDKAEKEALFKLDEIADKYGYKSPEANEAKINYAMASVVRENEFATIINSIEMQRFLKLKTAEAIIEDAKQQTQDAIIYIYVRVRDFVPKPEAQKKYYIIDMSGGSLNSYPLKWDYEVEFTEQKQQEFKPEEATVLLDAKGVSTYILREVIARHIEALKGKPEEKQLLNAIQDIITNSPYTAETPPAKAEIITADSAIFKSNMPMYHGKATDALATLSNKDAEQSPITDRAVFKTTTKDGDYRIVIQDFSKLKGKLSVNTHKLLSTGIAEFTQINNYGGGTVIPKVVIPFDEYARLLGYEIDERETDTPEAAAKEKKRAAETIKTAKKRIRQDLEILQAMRWTWQEKVKGKGEDFDSILLLERVAIRKGYIIMEFGRNMAEYLKKLPLTQYPQGLLAVDARKENAYRIGLKMAEHFNNDNNQIRGTADRLKVSTLLAMTGLPTIEALQSEIPDDSRHWDRRIKDPFETALDELTGKVILDWKYVKAKGAPLTETEAYSITDYEVFANLLVQFSLIEAPDHKDRLARRAEDKKKAAAKKAAKEGSNKKKKATAIKK